mgnify:CR=1 FL=1
MTKKSYASVSIKSPDCQKKIDVDVSDCAGLIEMFEKVDEVIKEHGLVKPGDKLDWIYFYDVEG